MSEFSSVSASSFDPGSLAAKLTEKTAEGWEVVAIVPTGGDVTAFLSRSSGAASAPAAAVPGAVDTSAWAPEPEPARAPDPVAEPAGWGVAPDPAPPTAVSPVHTPAPAAAPSAPSVPAGWYADPAGRFELRYWDGGSWTEHVSRAGQQFTDPPVA